MLKLAVLILNVRRKFLSFSEFFETSNFRYKALQHIVGTWQHFNGMWLCGNILGGWNNFAGTWQHFGGMWSCGNNLVRCEDIMVARDNIPFSDFGVN